MEQDLQTIKEGYKECLVRNLCEKYKFEFEDARELVNNSVVSQMLDESEDAARWQMHQSLESTLKELVIGVIINENNTRSSEGIKS